MANRLRYTLANIDWLAYHTYSHSQIIFTMMRMRVPGSSRVIWRAIQHGAQYSVLFGSVENLIAYLHGKGLLATNK